MQKKLLSSFLVILLMGICAIVNAQPANDEPSGAIEVTLGQNGPFTTTDATANPDDLAGGTCSTNDWNEPDVQSSVWFTYAGDGNEIIITTNNECIDAGANEVSDTQIAIFEGAADGPNVACHDDISGANYYSTVQFATTAGTTYYVLVDGWANDNNPLIVGDFCIVLEDPNAAVCGNGICDPGEDFENCPDDCVCEANSVYVDLSGPSISDVPVAYCPSESDAIPEGNIGVAVATFGGIGDLTDFPYDFTANIGTPNSQLETDGTNVSIGYLLFTQAELDAGGTVTITFASTINSCGSELSFDIADLNILDIANTCVPESVCGNGVCEPGEDNASCPGDCPVVAGTCGEFEGGPWTDISATSCTGGETLEAGFASWANEAYILTVSANTQYTFSMCDGYDAATEGWNGGVVLSAYVDADEDGTVDDITAPIATGTECSLTFVAEADGTILLVVNDANCTGALVQNDNGLVSITTEVDCGTFTAEAVCGNGICEEGEDAANCPDDCGTGARCGEFEGGPWTDISATSCTSGGVIEAGFASWANEAYILNVAANTQYTFSMCDGYDAATEGWNGGVVLSAYYDTDEDGAIDDIDNPLATGTECSLTFVTPNDGVILLVVNDASCTGVLVQNDNGLVSITTEVDCGSYSSGAICGNGVCEEGEDAANCPDDCGTGARCGEFEGGPWTDISATSCTGGDITEAGFASWANEAYILNVAANTQYTFSMCDGFDAGTEGWNGGVVLSAYYDADGDGAIDDIDNPLATGTECSLTFVTPDDGVILFVVNDASCTGVLVQNDNGLVSITTEVDCGTYSTNVSGEACTTANGCTADYGSPSANIPLLTLPPGAISEAWEFTGFNTDPGYIFGYILTADLDCNDNTTGYNILDFNTTGIFDFAFDGPLSYDGGGIGPGCFGANAGLYNVFAISYQGTQAELENLIFNVYPTAEGLEDAILAGDVCACMPSPGDDDQGLYSLFIVEDFTCEAEAGTVTNPAGGTIVCSGGGSITVGVSGNNTDAANYIQVYVLTDLSFTIIEVSANGVFAIPSGTGGYIAHSLNVNADEAGTLNQNLIGLNVADVFAQLICFDVSPGTEYGDDDVVTVSEEGLTINQEYDCNENTGESTVTLSITGGSGSYTITGDINRAAVAGENIVVSLTPSDRDISIVVYDDAGCTSSLAQVYPECTKTAVELLSFEGRAQANDNLLFWATATEENSSHFNVQRSSDGYTFTTIGKIAGAGNSNVTMNYNYNDVNVDAGTATYRLEMVDFDGSVEYSNTVTLTRRSDFGIVELAPVPAINLLNVAFNTVEEAVTRVEILSVSGRVLSVVEVESGIGINRVQLDITDYASGIYLISVANGENHEIKKFIKE